MGGTNNGNQTITFNYKYSAKGSEFSKVFRNVFKTGIYNGLTITKVGDTTVSIAPGIAVINVDTDKCIVVKTKNSFNLELTSGTPIIYTKFDWVEETENYADFLTRAEGSSITNEVILGKCNFSGGAITTIDYTDKTLGNFNENYNILADEINEYNVGSGIKFNNEVNVDTINENTTNNGTIIEGNQLTAGELKTNEINEKTNDNGININDIIFKDGKVRNVIYNSISQVGNSFLFGAEWEGEHTLIDNNNVVIGLEETLYNFKFDGTNWTCIGWTTISPVENFFGLATLNSTDIAVLYFPFFASVTQYLKTYRWNGSNWSQVGNTYITNSLDKAITTLNSTDLVCGNSSGVQLFRWDGSDWTPIGSSYSFDGYHSNAFVSALTSTDIVVFRDRVSPNENELARLRWNGSSWDLIGNISQIGLATSFGGYYALNDIDFVLLDKTNDKIQIYRFDGMDWNLSSTPYSSIGITTYAQLIILNGLEFALFTDVSNYLTTYKLVSNSLSLPWNPSNTNFS